jgi:hypothetical protein
VIPSIGAPLKKKNQKTPKMLMLHNSLKNPSNDTKFGTDSQSDIYNNFCEANIFFWRTVKKILTKFFDSANIDRITKR